MSDEPLPIPLKPEDERLQKVVKNPLLPADFQLAAQTRDLRSVELNRVGKKQ